MIQKTKTLNNCEISMLCLEISLFLHAGMDIGSSLSLIAKESQLQEALETMSERVSDGAPLSEAAEESGLFPRECIAMLRIGEKTGRLEEVLNSLADYYSYCDSVVRRIRSAVFYPSVLLIVMLAVIVVLLVKVVPVFEEVYAAFGGEMGGMLPVLGTILRSALPVLCIFAGTAAIALIVGLYLAGRRPGTLLAKRGIAGKMRTAQFAQALQMSIASGLSPEEAVETAGMILADQPETAERCRICLDRLEEGASLADAAAEAELLPVTECRLLELALLSGSAERGASEIAHRLEQEAENALERGISRIEPALVLTASLLIGGILLGVVFPMANLMNLIG